MIQWHYCKAEILDVEMATAPFTFNLLVELFINVFWRNFSHYTLCSAETQNYRPCPPPVLIYVASGSKHVLHVDTIVYLF